MLVWGMGWGGGARRRTLVLPHLHGDLAGRLPRQVGLAPRGGQAGREGEGGDPQQGRAQAPEEGVAHAEGEGRGEERVGGEGEAERENLQVRRVEGRGRVARGGACVRGHRALAEK